MSRATVTMIAAALMLSTAGLATAAGVPPPSSVEKVLLENEKVRVVEVSFKPGAVDKMQDRLPRVVHYLTDTHFTVTFADGKSVQRDNVAGSAAWRAGDRTEVTNTGREEARLTVTYLK
jgi:hypothetical protein